MNSWANTRIVKPIPYGPRSSALHGRWHPPKRSVNKPPDRCMSHTNQRDDGHDDADVDDVAPHAAQSAQSVTLRGLRPITSSVCGSTPIANAGAASVSRLIHSNCVASSGTVTPTVSGGCRGSRQTPHRGHGEHLTHIWNSASGAGTCGCCRRSRDPRVRRPRWWRSCRPPESSWRSAWSLRCR